MHCSGGGSDEKLHPAAVWNFVVARWSSCPWTEPPQRKHGATLIHRPQQCEREGSRCTAGRGPRNGEKNNRSPAISIGGRSLEGRCSCERAGTYTATGEG